jgi:hypothetical protein
MNARRLVQQGLITGPVDCHCSECFWAASFVAIDSSVPSHLMSEFHRHNCNDHRTVACGGDR